ncbi:hypothetical protein DPMN_120537 [Dreissena polymorpha]|uniref:Uncharacterized protein n=1 Tax=Dreissena polymorpha TaxID=45954 RepID=A0A9D4JNM8_DREPO|nr:hypothetical protein DPMN_120537 [Dreissena polymorpha]
MVTISLTEIWIVVNDDNNEHDGRSGVFVFAFDNDCDVLRLMTLMANGLSLRRSSLAQDALIALHIDQVMIKEGILKLNDSDMCREIGRAGRDGDPALAVVFAYPRSKKDDAIRTMVHAAECVRRTNNNNNNNYYYYYYYYHHHHHNNHHHYYYYYYYYYLVHQDLLSMETIMRTLPKY